MAIHWNRQIQVCFIFLHIEFDLDVNNAVFVPPEGSIPICADVVDFDWGVRVRYLKFAFLHNIRNSKKRTEILT